MRSTIPVSGAALAVCILALAACRVSPEPRRSAAQAPSTATTTTSTATQTSRPTSTPRSSSPARVASDPLARTQASRTAPIDHCAHNHAAQKAIVSIAAQHMWMCRWHRTVYDTPITTGKAGRGTRTPTGNYRIEGRNRDTTLTLTSGAAYDVKYWIPFDAPAYGFHDSPWQHFPYGSPKYRTDGSHGCVHMPLHAIAFFYRWVARPTAVHIS